MTTSGTADHGLRLIPFHGLRYVPERVGSLAAVTSPPYDVVVRPDGVDHLESADPHNIVRLILPQAGTPAARNEQAARTLHHWLAEGILSADPEPALYVYEQRRAGVLQRGVIGALALSTADAGIVLPHEDVMPDVVTDRAGLMRATSANLEPLLLTYRGDDPATGAAAVVERTAQRAPLLSTTTEDGFQHRLWAITDPVELAAVTADLSHRQALIADGHHRWATYLRLQEEHGSPTPWDFGLVLLVDTARYPLQVRAIHRMLRRLPVADALAALDGRFRVRPVDGPLPWPWTPSRTPPNAATPSSSPATAPSTWSPTPTWRSSTARSATTGPRPGAGWTPPSCTRRCSTPSGTSRTPPTRSRTSTTRSPPSPWPSGTAARRSCCIRYARRSYGTWPARASPCPASPRPSDRNRPPAWSCAAWADLLRT